MTPAAHAAHITKRSQNAISDRDRAAPTTAANNNHSFRSKHLVGANGYSPLQISFYNQTNNAGGGAGQSVTISMATTFQDQYGVGVLPESGYCAAVTPKINRQQLM